MARKGNATARQPGNAPDSTGIEHGLSSGEGFGHDNHQGGLLAEAIQGTGHVHGVHIGQEAQIALASLVSC